MAVSLAPVAHQQFLAANGAPLAGGFVFTYAAGTTTPLATYTDSTGSTPNANPIVLDAGGFANIWLTSSVGYKFTVQNSASVTQWTVDNILSGSGGVGGGTFAISPQSVSFNASVFSTLYLVTTAASTIVATLPSIVPGNTGSQLIIKKVDAGAGTVVLTPSGGAKIDGLTTFTLSAQFQYMGLVSDGTNWQIFTRN